MSLVESITESDWKGLWDNEFSSFGFVINYANVIAVPVLYNTADLADHYEQNIYQSE